MSLLGLDRVCLIFKVTQRQFDIKTMYLHSSNQIKGGKKMAHEK